MTIQELRHAVNLAGFYLKIDSAMQYGLLTGPKVNVDKCLEMLAKGKAAGILPDENFIDPEITGELLKEKYDIGDWIMTKGGMPRQITSDFMPDFEYQDIARLALAHEIPTQK